MAEAPISPSIRKELASFLKEQKKPELLTAYLFFVEKKFNLKPVASLRDKLIYKNSEDAVEKLEKEGKIWRETEIKIGIGPPSVNEETKKIYICPFTGKVFGDNTHPNPQDAIYDWVSKCPENTERSGGVKAKRFFVSEDPEVIKNYIKPTKEPLTKIVFSSAASGKLYQTKDAIIEEFKNDYLKPMTLVQVQNQNRFQMEGELLEFVQGQLQEEKITRFVEGLAEHEEFLPYVTKWVEG